MDTTTSRGSCLCGAVRFHVHFPSNWVAHCHCTRCQRAHGAAFVTWAGFDAASVHLEDDGGLLHWYVAAEGGSRGFCSRCGSPMFFKSEKWPGELHIARALFVAPIDHEPMAHSFHESHVEWVALTDDLPKLADPS